MRRRRQPACCVRQRRYSRWISSLLSVHRWPVRERRSLLRVHPRQRMLRRQGPSSLPRERRLYRLQYRARLGRVRLLDLRSSRRIDFNTDVRQRRHVRGAPRCDDNGNVHCLRRRWHCDGKVDGHDASECTRSSLLSVWKRTDGATPVTVSIAVGGPKYTDETSTLKCFNIPPGKERVDASSIQQCEEGYECPGANIKNKCANGDTRAGSTVCSPCTAGQFENGTLCSDCTPGNECPDGKDQVSCPGKDDVIESGIVLAAAGGEYVCWTSAAADASISIPTCGSVGNTEVHLDAMTTGTSTVCGAAGIATAKWTVTTQVNVRALHCSASGSHRMATPITVSIAVGGPKYTDETSTLKCFNIPPGKERVDAASIKHAKRVRVPRCQHQEQMRERRYARWFSCVQSVHRWSVPPQRTLSTMRGRLQMRRRDGGRSHGVP